MSRRKNINALRRETEEAEQGVIKMAWLKGNYDLNNQKTVSAAREAETGTTEAFEKFARERLGGSIAFVMKNNTFVWTGDETGPIKENTTSTTVSDPAGISSLHRKCE